MPTLLDLQDRRDLWGKRIFGDNFFTREEFAFRFLEEATELAQAMGLTEEEVNRQTSVVYSRPAGEVSQEIAGTQVTLMALASSESIDLENVTVLELDRIHQPEIAQKILDRQPAKRADGLTRSVNA
jgi:hypothetical protein